MAEKKFPPVTFEYIKSTDYKVYQVHGGIGGPTPYGDVVCNLYFERNPIPKRVTHLIDENGGLGSPTKIEQKDGMIRDVLFGLSMSPSHAKSIGKWLIETAEKLETEIKKDIFRHDAEDDK